MPRANDEPTFLPQDRRLFRFLCEDLFDFPSDSDPHTTLRRPLFDGLTELTRATARHSPKLASLTPEEREKKQRNRVSFVRQVLLGIRGITPALRTELSAAVENRIALLPEDTQKEMRLTYQRLLEEVKYLRVTRNARSLKIAPRSSMYFKERFIVCPCLPSGLAFPLGESMIKAFAAMYSLTLPHAPVNQPSPYRFTFCFDGIPDAYRFLVDTLFAVLPEEVPQTTDLTDHLFSRALDRMIYLQGARSLDFYLLPPTLAMIAVSIDFVEDVVESGEILMYGDGEVTLSKLTTPFLKRWADFAKEVKADGIAGAARLQLSEHRNELLRQAKERFRSSAQE
jgi:hypothetical protein